MNNEDEKLQKEKKSIFVKVNILASVILYLIFLNYMSDILIPLFNLGINVAEYLFDFDSLYYVILGIFLPVTLTLILYLFPGCAIFIYHQESHLSRIKIFHFLAQVYMLIIILYFIMC